MRFNLYGDGMETADLADLIAENNGEGSMIARAENSGCEGCYVEVAKWNDDTQRWERYAFVKVFGGEHATEHAERTYLARETASKFARDINAAYVDGGLQRLIHDLPDFGSGGDHVTGYTPIVEAQRLEIVALGNSLDERTSAIAEAISSLCAGDYDDGGHPLVEQVIKSLRDSIGECTADLDRDYEEFNRPTGTPEMSPSQFDPQHSA